MGGVLLDIIMAPRYLLGLFTQEKSFTANPIIGSRLANRLGLHVLRILLAHGLTHLRWWMLAGLVPTQERRRFHEDGFLIIEDFLPEEEFAAFEREVRAYRGPAWEMIQGDTLTQRVFLDEVSLRKLPMTRQVLEARRYQRLLSYTGSTLAKPQILIQRIANGYAGGHPDPQKTLHVDTFHPTMKAWLFVDDVSEDRGPFTYVPGSHRLTWRRLRWEYRQSLKARESENSHVRSGSFRLHDEDLKELGVSGGKPVAVRKNTLVLANTFGMHCRGAARGRVERLELWAYSRKNPFAPWPGVGARWYSRIESRIVRKAVASRERRAAAQGKRAIWRTISIDLGSNKIES